MTTLAKVITGIILSLFCCSCNIVINGTSGEGEVIKKERIINEPYTAVKVNRGINVILFKSNDHTVTVEANENLHEIIEISVSNGVLKVTSKENIYRADAKNVYVPYQELRKLSATSGAEITAQEVVKQKILDLSATSGAHLILEIKSDSLSTSATSGAIMKLNGRTNNHRSNATSGAGIKAQELLSIESKAKATSGASIRIHAKEVFDGRATSGADVVYYGNPEKVSETDNSGGNVRKD